MSVFKKYIITPYFFEMLRLLKHNFFFRKYKSLFVNNRFDNVLNNADKRCFIIGSGPSISNLDLSKLKNENVITVNNVFTHDQYSEFMVSTNRSNKHHIIAPLHDPQTEADWLEWLKKMEKLLPINVILYLGFNNFKFNTKFFLDKYNLFKSHSFFYYYPAIDSTILGYEFSSDHIDFSKLIWSSDSGGVYALMLAINMGYKEIYLLGMDHNYICQDVSNWRFYKNENYQKNDINSISSNYTSFNEHLLFSTGKILRQYNLININTNSKIYNCSQSSLLDMFEKVNFDKLF